MRIVNWPTIEHVNIPEHERETAIIHMETYGLLPCGQELGDYRSIPKYKRLIRENQYYKLIFASREDAVDFAQTARTIKLWEKLGIL